MAIENPNLRLSVIGIEKDDTTRFVFLYLVNRRIPVDFRQFLIRHLFGEEGLAGAEDPAQL